MEFNILPETHKGCDPHLKFLFRVRNYVKELRKGIREIKMNQLQVYILIFFVLFSVCHSRPLVGCDPGGVNSQNTTSVTNDTVASGTHSSMEAIPTDIERKIRIRKGLPFCNGEKGWNYNP
ncbi:hypothetical protein K501DRAFT_329076 [Backusella circina FSU 941]|nr:hypothetical protein K501DRAFT_329076 [Backusella circina FSU 941]